MSPVQLVRKKRFRKFSEVKLQRSRNHRGISTTVKCCPFVLGIAVRIPESATVTHLINFNPNLLHLGSVPWNPVESISLEVFLRRLQLLHRLPHKRWDLDNLPRSCATLYGQMLKQQVLTTILHSLQRDYEYLVELLFMERATKNRGTLQNTWNRTTNTWNRTTSQLRVKTKHIPAIVMMIVFMGSLQMLVARSSSLSSSSSSSSSSPPSNHHHHHHHHHYHHHQIITIISLIIIKSSSSPSPLSSSSSSSPSPSCSSSPCAVMASTVGRRSILLPIFFLLKLNDASTELKHYGNDNIEEDYDNDEEFKIQSMFVNLNEGRLLPVFGRGLPLMHTVCHLAKGSGQTCQ